MDIRGIERYILLGYTSEKASGYRIKLRHFVFGSLWYLAAILILIWGLEIRFLSAERSLLGFSIRFGLHPVIYIIVALLICLVAFLVAKNGRLAVNELSESTREEAPQQENTKKGAGKKIAAVGGCAGFFGMTLARDLLRWRPELNQAMGIILCVFFVLLMYLFAFAHFYKFYLTIKYCPYLKKFEDRRYDQDAET